MSDDERDDRVADPREETIVEILGFEGEAGDGDEPEERPVTGASGSGGGPGVEERRLESELAAQKERYLRIRADFDNFRKRAERDRAEAERYALTEPARELLPVVDNLERALAASGQGEDLRKGVEMILRQLEEALRRFGIEPVSALGERFDPSVHEAVMREESPDVAAPVVVAEFQRGYRLNGRLIRPSMVKVAVPHEVEEAQAPVPETEPGD